MQAHRCIFCQRYYEPPTEHRYPSQACDLCWFEIRVAALRAKPLRRPEPDWPAEYRKQPGYYEPVIWSIH